MLSEAVDLLEKIVNDKGQPGSVPLLQAISDGTFGLMKRPPDAGKGLDGVVKCASGYDNPASTLLEAGAGR